MKERLLNHPELFGEAVLAWLPLAIAGFFVIMWMIQGDVSGPVGILVLFACLVAGFFIIKPPSDAWAPWLALSSWLAFLSYPVFKSLARRRDLAELDKDSIARAYAALGLHPDNPAARLQLARALYGRGMANAAIDLAEPALARLPGEHYAADARAVQGWKLHAGGPRPASYRCETCGFENRPGQIFCQGCGGRLFLDHLGGGWSGPDSQKLLAVCGTLVLLGAGIPLASDLLPAGMAIAASCAMVALAGYAIYGVLHEPEQGA